MAAVGLSGAVAEEPELAAADVALAGTVGKAFHNGVVERATASTQRTIERVDDPSDDLKRDFNNLTYLDSEV